MLYEAITLGSKKFHDCDYGPGYDEALKKQLNWAQQDCPTEPEVESLVGFVNSWSTRMKKDIPAIRRVLNEILPELNELRCNTILDVNLCDQSTSELICRSFKKLANFGSRKAPTGASKMLHIIYPELFVMWDGAIRVGYGYGNGSKSEGKQYTDFLRRMQMLAKFAIKQVRENEPHYSDETAIASLTSCKRTLAKTLDEYNYVKFTLNDESVWKKEYEL